MSFVPAVPLGGYAGWRLLQATLPAQKAAYAADPRQAADAAHFRARIGAVRNVDDLLADRRLLATALGAFGLSEDIGARAFLRAVLTGDPADPAALVNRLADKRYLALNRAFGFTAPGGPRTGAPGFADGILAAGLDKGFAAAVGTQEPSLRLALNLKDELPSLARAGGSENAKWYSLLASPRLRAVFQTAFGLPAAFAAIDIDRQLAVMKEKARAALGTDSLTAIAQDGMEKVIRLYLLRADTGGGSAGADALAAGLRGGSGAAVALGLLGGVA
ncbi:MAG: DUF1217 domain-containing protein [Rhodobacteraceae bacterium]|nr:DUF1217 domain-containing protein [Paracoccaceae bacterium]